MKYTKILSVSAQLEMQVNFLNKFFGDLCDFLYQKNVLGNENEIKL